MPLVCHRCNMPLVCHRCNYMQAGGTSDEAATTAMKASTTLPALGPAMYLVDTIYPALIQDAGLGA
jgi:hypothetical protein